MSIISNNTCKSRDLILEHFKKYPALRIDDVMKFVFQSSFGCEHLVSDEQRAVAYIREEYENVGSLDNATPWIEKLDGAFSRVNLSVLSDGLSPETLGRLFCLSAKETVSNSVSVLEEKLKVVREMINEGLLPFDQSQLEEFCSVWKSGGYKAIRHSQTFRDAYSPAYRVISDKYVDFLPLFIEIDKLLSRGSAIIAIEGPCASGKSTLAQMLESVYDCNVFHMDDFFLRPEQRTPRRMNEIGGNVDRERFQKEVLGDLALGNDVSFRPFNCSKWDLDDPISISFKKLSVVEGVYSMHTDLAGYYDLSVFLDIDRGLQNKRILKRNSPEFAKKFFEIWIPLEDQYFEKMNVKSRCSLTIPILDKEL